VNSKNKRRVRTEVGAKISLNARLSVEEMTIINF